MNFLYESYTRTRTAILDNAWSVVKRIYVAINNFLPSGTETNLACVFLRPIEKWQALMKTSFRLSDLQQITIIRPRTSHVYLCPAKLIIRKNDQRIQTSMLLLLQLYVTRHGISSIHFAPIFLYRTRGCFCHRLSEPIRQYKRGGQSEGSTDISHGRCKQRTVKLFKRNLRIP